MTENSTPENSTPDSKQEHLPIALKYELNVDLADKLVKWIRESVQAQYEHDAPTPDIKWDQQLWYRGEPECGTACCAAGYIAHTQNVLGRRDWSGIFGSAIFTEPMFELVESKPNHLGQIYSEWLEMASIGTSPSAHTPDGTTNWEYVGAFYLGVPPFAANKLFFGENQLEDIERVIAELKVKYA